MEQTKYLRPTEAAAFLGIGKSTLWAWVKTRPEFPRPLRPGPRVTLFDQQALQRFVQGG